MLHPKGKLLKNLIKLRLVKVTTEESTKKWSGELVSKIAHPGYHKAIVGGLLTYQMPDIVMDKYRYAIIVTLELHTIRTYSCYSLFGNKKLPVSEKEDAYTLMTATLRAEPISIRLERDVIDRKDDTQNSPKNVQICLDRRQLDRNYQIIGLEPNLSITAPDNDYSAKVEFLQVKNEPLFEKLRLKNQFRLQCPEGKEREVAKATREIMVKLRDEVVTYLKSADIEGKLFHKVTDYKYRDSNLQVHKDKDI